VASIALPGLVAGFVLTAYIAWEVRNVREAEGRASELSAQLMRREIEIGRMATVDELTGLATRREFDESIRLECSRTQRHRRELSLILLEIDDIAELGENVGKLSKGYLLSEVSGILRDLLRTNDLGARYTNDCLALLLPETAEKQAAVVAAKIRASVAAHQFLGQLGDKAVSLTVSQGIACLASAVDGADALMRAAEQALCEARADGFGQVHVYQPPQHEEELPLAS
jgi:diguanylate cyclase (GGDEF)-like protein